MIMVMNNIPQAGESSRSGLRIMGRGGGERWSGGGEEAEAECGMPRRSSRVVS